MRSVRRGTVLLALALLLAFVTGGTAAASGPAGAGGTAPAALSGGYAGPAQLPGAPSADASAVTPCLLDMRWPTLSLTFDYAGAQRYYTNALQGARNWSNLGTGLTISPVASGADISFVDYSSPTDSTYASTEIPPAWTSPPDDPTHTHPYKSVPANPHTPEHITINLNQAFMDRLDDAHQTYAVTHELGHALGLAHSDDCTSAPSIMRAGGADVATRPYNTPQTYDRLELEELYELELV